ncbi:MBOAT family O-acyltransferase [Flavobacteriaceae bacterium MEBiC06459]
MVVSYIFYGWWDWRFLMLIAFSSLVDYILGIQISKSESKRIKKYFLGLSLFVNLGILGFFKYYNFFLENFINAFHSIGIQMHASSLQVILPVGISFYTFQTLSYTIDIYRGQLKPTKNAVHFFAYVSFFPQLVAGPIERASNLLPQFSKKRHFNEKFAADGMKQILWGFFKKMVIADNCAVFVNQIFDAPQDYNSVTLIFGTVLFAFQIYGDFSGYSDIAIGVSKLFGFSLMTNFRTPYFSRDIAEFWRRWHISLSTWFRDYLYIPLGGSRGGKWIQIRNTFIIFLVSGFWHGANWTFIVWGALHALFFLPLLLTNKNRIYTNTVAQNTMLPTLKELLLMGITFSMTCFAWIFFRANSLTLAFEYINSIIMNKRGFFGEIKFLRMLPVLGVFLLIDWLFRIKESPFHISKYKLINSSVIIITIILFVWMANFLSPQEFIYFDF